MRRIVPLVCLLFLMTNCATFPEMSTSDISQRQPDEGVVFGSVLLKKVPAEGEEATASTGKGGKTWTVYVHPSGWSGQSFSIKAREGEEKTFATRIAGGKYIFFNATATVNLYTATLDVPLRVPFNAEPGKVLYIGQLVVDLTETKGLGLVSGAKYNIKINDTQEATTESLKPEYGQALDGAGKALMGSMQ